jgi:ankyrin repeat protein
MTALHWASSRGNDHVVKLLLMGKANPNAVTKVGSARQQCIQTSIVPNPCPILFLIKLGQTPLHLACKAQYSETVRALLAGGADVHLKNNVRPLEWLDTLRLCVCSSFCLHERIH